MARLIGVVAFLQFALNGLEGTVPRLVMKGAWFSAALVALYVTVLSEMYKFRRPG